MEQAVQPIDEQFIIENSGAIQEMMNISEHEKFFTSPFQEEIWRDNYQFENETIGGTMERLVRSIYPNIRSSSNIPDNAEDPEE